MRASNTAERRLNTMRNAARRTRRLTPCSITCTEPHDAMEIDLPLRGSSHLEAFRKNRREGIPDDPEFPSLVRRRCPRD